MCSIFLHKSTQRTGDDQNRVFSSLVLSSGSSHTWCQSSVSYWNFMALPSLVISDPGLVEAWSARGNQQSYTWTGLNMNENQKFKTIQKRPKLATTFSFSSYRCPGFPTILWHHSNHTNFLTMILPWSAWHHIVSRVRSAWNHIWPRIWSGWNHKLWFLWNMAYHRLDHICPEYDQLGTNLYCPEYDQPGIILWVWWQSMIDLFLYGRETRVDHSRSSMECLLVSVRGFHSSLRNLWQLWVLYEV